MTPKQVAMVQTSWLEVDPISDAVATLFYERLFDLDPTLRRLFRRTDMVQQRRILMQTLAVVVRSLDRLEQLTPAIEGLGRRHAGYGVRENHYDKVGEALLWTLREGLGEAFTLEVRSLEALTRALALVRDVPGVVAATRR